MGRTRRDFLKGTGAAAGGLLAGCSGSETEGSTATDQAGQDANSGGAETEMDTVNDALEDKTETSAADDSSSKPADTASRDTPDSSGSALEAELKAKYGEPVAVNEYDDGNPMITARGGNGYRFKVGRTEDQMKDDVEEERIEIDCDSDRLVELFYEGELVDDEEWDDFDTPEVVEDENTSWYVERTSCSMDGAEVESNYKLKVFRK